MHQAEINILTMEIIVGELPKRVRNLVMEWAIEHREELILDWELMRDDQKPNPIEPLI